MGGRRRGTLDQVALELSPKVLLEAPDLVPAEAVAPRVAVCQVRLRLGPQPERAPDPLHVDSEHARSLAWHERRDRELGEVAQRRLGAALQSGSDLLAEGIEVDLALHAGARLALGDLPARRLRFSCPEEEAVEHQLEHAPILG